MEANNYKSTPEMFLAGLMPREAKHEQVHHWTLPSQSSEGMIFGIPEIYQETAKLVRDKVVNEIMKLSDTADANTVSADQVKSFPLLQKTKVGQNVTLDLKLDEPVFFGEINQRRYKFTLKIFNEGVMCVEIVEVSRGVGHVLISRRFIHGSSNAAKITIPINYGQ